jgi:hypothetical protein
MKLYTYPMHDGRVGGDISSVVKRRGREAEYSRQCSDEYKNTEVIIFMFVDPCIIVQFIK